MNTSQVFLRYFQSDDDANEIEGTSLFVSVSDIDCLGCPIDEDGNDLDNDCLVYVFNGESYEVIDKRDLID
jgi:hypothetical protein